MTRADLAGILTSSETPKEIKSKIYIEYIRSIALYAGPAWRKLLHKETVKKLETHERKLIKSIFRLRRSTKNQDVYEITGLTPLMEVIDKNCSEYRKTIYQSKILEVRSLAPDNAELSS